MKMMSKWLQMLMFGFTPMLCFAEEGAGGGGDSGEGEGEGSGEGAPAGRKSALAGEEEEEGEGSGEGEGGEGEGSGEGESGEPVNYAEIELPEGIKLDEKALEHFAPFLQAKGVTAEEAKDLFGQFAEYQNQQITAANEQFNKEWDADVEVVSKIPKEDMAAAKKARDAFFDEDGVKLLEGRLGDVPAVVNALVKIGKAMAEDKFVEGEGVNDGGRPAEDVLYPTMKK